MKEFTIDLDIADSIIWNYFSYIFAYIFNEFKEFNIDSKKCMSLENLINKIFEMGIYKNIQLKKKIKVNFKNKCKTPIKIIESLLSIREKIEKHYKTKVKSFQLLNRIQSILKEAEKKKVTVRNPNIWGSKVWKMLHLVSCSNKTLTRKQLESIFLLIFENLPCSICYHHTQNYLQEKQLQTVPSKSQFVYYIIDFRNFVSMNHASSDPEKRKQKKKVNLNFVKKNLSLKNN